MKSMQETSSEKIDTSVGQRSSTSDHCSEFGSTDLQSISPVSLNPSSILSDASNAKRKSAFLPYRPQAKVLTNLQRGNTEATFCPAEVTLSFHERSGQGEITEEQVEYEVQRQNQQGDSIDFKDTFGFTALHWAAYYGQLNAVKFLIDVKADVNAEAPEMVTPLLLAASGGHHEVVKYLLGKGAIATHMDIVGNTALMYAAAGNHPHTCNELLSNNPDLTVSNINGDTAYSLAVENGSVLSQAVIEQYLIALLSL